MHLHSLMHSCTHALTNEQTPTMCKQHPPTILQLSNFAPFISLTRKNIRLCANGERFRRRQCRISWHYHWYSFACLRLAVGRIRCVRIWSMSACHMHVCELNDHFPDVLFGSPCRRDDCSSTDIRKMWFGVCSWHANYVTYPILKMAHNNNLFFRYPLPSDQSRSAIPILWHSTMYSAHNFRLLLGCGSH